MCVYSLHNSASHAPNRLIRGLYYHINPIYKRTIKHKLFSSMKSIRKAGHQVRTVVIIKAVLDCPIS